MSRRPYLRKIKRSWWLGHRRYVVYMVRELTSLFVGLYCALLVVGLWRLVQGRVAWEGFLAALSSPLAVAFQLVCLVFVAFHSGTWFALTPKAMPLMLRGEPVPAKTIVGLHYGAWALVSLIVLIAAAGV
jgi:fumarate reductase subunit C